MLQMLLMHNAHVYKYPRIF